jgi:hypothetical protein
LLCIPSLSSNAVVLVHGNAGRSQPLTDVSDSRHWPAQNMVLRMLVKIARALGRGVEITFPARRP